MLTYTFDDLEGETLYMHLYRCIRSDILSGKLAPGTKLPSKRSFASHLGVSVVTVENAYSQLQSEGFIYSRPKSGFYVASIPSDQAADQPEAEENPGRIATGSRPAQPKLSLASSRTAEENFPFSLWAKLMRDVLSQNQKALMTPSPAGGIPELRQAIAQHLRQFRSMDVQPEQIIVGAGTEYLYSLLIQLLGYEKKYAVEAPGYQKLTRIYESHHVECIHVPLDSSGIDISYLREHGADVAHISPSHHYPTGMVTPIRRRYELLAWAGQAEDRYIIEDDYDSEFRLSGRPIPTLQSIDRGESVIYMNTFTKTLSPTIRISYMVLPRHLLRKFSQNLGFYSCTVSNFEQYTLARFISEGHFERHINRMRTHYRAIRDGLITALKESSFGGQIQIRNADSGLHFLLYLDTGIPDQELLRRAAEQGLGLSFLSQYQVLEKPGPQHTMIVSYAGLHQEEIDQAVKILEKCLS